MVSIRRRTTATYVKRWESVRFDGSAIRRHQPFKRLGVSYLSYSFPSMYDLVSCFFIVISCNDESEAQLTIKLLVWCCRLVEYETPEEAKGAIECLAGTELDG